MANDNTPSKTQTAEVAGKQPVEPVSGIPAGALVGMGTGGTLQPGGTAALRKGGITLDVGTDVTSQLDASAPAFGSVLLSIGNGVAQSQKALDKGVVDMVNALNNTNITVVTDVVETLNDDGLPDASKTQLVTQNVSVLNYFTPTVHEWKNVAVSMDLTIDSFHQTQGVQFSKHQDINSDNNTGLFWGFLGWTDYSTETKDTSFSSNTTTEVAWQSGNVAVDAILGPRRTGKFPVPDSVQIGPQIFVSQGATVETKDGGGNVTARAVNLTITVRKADGSPNPGKNIVLNAGGLLPAFTGASGSTTDANGNVQVTLTRTLFPGFTSARPFTVSISLGQLRQTASVTL
jgi:hypothetical protein